MTPKEIEAIRQECLERVSTNGKFEGCQIYIPWLWGVALEHGIQPDENNVVWIAIESLDREIFPKLSDTSIIGLYESNEGFVYEY